MFAGSSRRGYADSAALRGHEACSMTTSMKLTHGFLSALALSVIVGACAADGKTPTSTGPNGVCPGAQFVPNNGLYFGGTGCVAWSCHDAETVEAIWNQNCTPPHGGAS